MRNLDQLAKEITRKSSFQTYLIIKFLVDYKRRPDCYKAYAYFRWLDDQIDTILTTKEARIQCIATQKILINNAYQQMYKESKIDEEKLIVELIKNNPKIGTKLEIFIRNFLAIIEFDANRKHQTITQKQFNWYTQTLGAAVTECIEYFIGNNNHYPNSPYHYNAAIAAHITHILRDYQVDIHQGYFNIPTEDTNQNITDWIKSQVKIAEDNFQKGKEYIRALSGFKIKLAALWYCDRFEWILKAIKKDNYKLRTYYYPKNKLTFFTNYLNSYATLAYRHHLKI